MADWQFPSWLRKKEDEDTSVLKLRMIQLKNDNDNKAREIAALNKQLEKYRIHEMIPIDIGDPVPTDKEKRTLYVSAVAGLFTEYVRPKLLQMIAKGRAILEQDENLREDDLRVKGMLFGLWEIIRWGDMLVSEYKAWLADQENNHGNENQGSERSE